MLSKKKGKKVAIAMSGGIDSSVAAALLKKQGYDCIGIFMKFWTDESVSKKVENRCCSQESYQKAKRVADSLDFPLYTLNFKKDFFKLVVDDFLQQYQKGLTPNPCIRCNKFIKFNLLLKKAIKLGCDYLATGHYVRKKKSKNDQFNLYRAKDKKKDQSYFLYSLNQQQLKYLIFPIGNYTKEEVKRLAKKYKLPAQWVRESQEVCFVPKKGLEDFLKRHLKLKPGDIITTDGKVVGKHEGLALYTRGQRRGIKIGGIGPFYVVRKDFKNNNLIVSKNKDDKQLYSKEFIVKNTNWLDHKSKLKNKYRVQIRYQAKPVNCQIKSLQKNKYVITSRVPIKAVTGGQSAVLYDGDRLLGGGIIEAN